MKKQITDGGQLDLFPVALAATITLSAKHPYVQISDLVDWATLQEKVDWATLQEIIEQVRKKKLKR